MDVARLAARVDGELQRHAARELLRERVGRIVRWHAAGTLEVRGEGCRIDGGRLPGSLLQLLHCLDVGRLGAPLASLSEIGIGALAGLRLNAGTLEQRPGE